MNFSVVIPLYNRANLIERAIRSVLGQTWQNFEILVVDDGSTDGGGDVVARISDPRIRCLRQENAGVSAARNRGIAEATRFAQTERFGQTERDYIAFLDSDDEWKPDCLEQFRQLIEEFPQCGLYAQSYELVISRKNNQSTCRSPRSLRGFPLGWKGHLPDYFKMAASSIPFLTSSTCVPREILEESGGFPIGVQMGEDLSLWLSIALRHPIALCHSQNVLHYIHLEGNASKTFYFGGYFEELLEKTLHAPETGLRGLGKPLGLVKPKLRQDLYEYYTFRMIMIARSYLHHGETANCRQALMKCRGTNGLRFKRFGLLWLRYWLLSFLPRVVLESCLR